MPERTPDSTTTGLARPPTGELAGRPTALEVIAAIPEEEIWLAGLKSDQTRRAYRRDVAHFVETLGIRSFEELRQVTHKHVIAWRRHMTGVDRLQNSTVRRRLSALSSLFTHLIERDPEVHQNPARDVDPDSIDRIVRKYALRVGLARDYSAHSMRATFITTALKNGAKFEDVQDAAGHANPSTTRLYDKRGYDPEKSASFFANY